MALVGKTAFTFENSRFYFSDNLLIKLLKNYDLLTTEIVQCLFRAGISHTLSTQLEGRIDLKLFAEYGSFFVQYNIRGEGIFDRTLMVAVEISEFLFRWGNSLANHNEVKILAQKISDDLLGK